MIMDKELAALLEIVEHGPLALDAPGADWGAAPAAVGGAGAAAPVQAAVFEPAGHAYERRWRVANGVAPEPEAEVEAEAAGPSSDEAKAEAARWEGFAQRKVKLEDYYALLNLKEKEVFVTADEVRAAYKRGSVLCHPDKAPPAKRKRAEARFEAMQKAYETLVDPALKRGYDSTLEFDDEVPSASEGKGDDFFEVYGPVFQRNARFSNNLPVPQLGDASSPYEEVDRFYDFWFSFHSWREFAHLNEHRLATADSREEKRWMARENAKKQASAKKDEAARVRRLVEGAMDKDPRVIAERKRQQELKKQRKRERNSAKSAAAEAAAAEKAAAKKAEEERKAAEAVAAAAAKEEKANAKIWRKVVRQTVRRKTFVEWPAADLELLIEHADNATLFRIASALCADFKQRDVPPSERRLAEGRQILAEELAAAREAKGLEARNEEERKAAAAFKARREEEAAAAKAKWTLDEESVLAKAVAKFPSGCNERWENIAAMVNASAGGDRNVKDVIAKVRAMDHERAKRHDDKEAYRVYLQKMGKDPDAEMAKAAAAAAAPAPAAQEEAKPAEPATKRAKAKAEKEAKAKAAAERKAAEDARRAKLEAERKAAEEAEAKRRAEVKAKARAEAQAKAQAKKEAEKAKKKARKARKAAAAAEAAAKAKSEEGEAAPKTEAAAEPAEAKMTEEERKEQEERQRKKAEGAHWSAEQQAQLESALRTVPKDLETRWLEVAKLVDGKTKKQCVRRFKEIRAKIAAE